MPRQLGQKFEEQNATASKGKGRRVVRTVLCAARLDAPQQCHANPSAEPAIKLSEHHEALTTERTPPEDPLSNAPPAGKSIPRTRKRQTAQSKNAPRV